MSQPSSPSNTSDGHNNSRFKNEFQEQNTLGQGTYGKVIRCRNILDRKEYAVKVVPYASSEEERTLWEVRTLARMCHPNVVLYHMAWTEEGVAAEFLPKNLPGELSPTSDSSAASFDKTLFIAMEACDETLEDKLKRPLSPNDAREIFFQILEGVKHIHQNEVVHRDLSTKNIFFDKHGVAKIGDFGLARFTEEGRVNLTKNSGQGASRYSAPETSDEDNPYALPSSDIFSLGIIFFELFHYMEDEFRATRVIISLRRSKEVPENWALPQFKKLLLNMIAKDPTHRPTLSAVKFSLKERQYCQAEKNMQLDIDKRPYKRRRFDELHTI